MKLNINSFHVLTWTTTELQKNKFLNARLVKVSNTFILGYVFSNKLKFREMNQVALFYVLILLAPHYLFYWIVDPNP